MLIDPLENIQDNSFRNFHAKGVDYVCLSRHPKLTTKAYFFDEAADNSVVCPHDHRYSFMTTVLAGELLDIRYTVDDRGGMIHQQFDWHSPLNQGNGFEFHREVTLRETERNRRTRRQSLESDARAIHTIKIKPGTVLLVQQFEDIYPLAQATSTFVPGAEKEPPNLDGLYDKMDTAHLIQRLTHLRELGIVGELRV